MYNLKKTLLYTLKASKNIFKTFFRDIKLFKTRVNLIIKINLNFFFVFGILFCDFYINRAIKPNSFKFLIKILFLSIILHTKLVILSTSIKKKFQNAKGIHEHSVREFLFSF